jgi:hypothetical protein
MENFWNSALSYHGGMSNIELFQAYLFNDYWEDIGTIKSFFEANLALAEQVCLLGFLHTTGNIFFYHFAFKVCIFLEKDY